MTTKRFAKDLQKFYESGFDKDGIFIHIDESNMTEVRAMIVGNSETPYEYGFHFFTITITETYPLDPPSVKYVTGDGVTRFNPNLYVEGKVCLSIINTWSGPKWSPVMTFGQILLSIKSMILNSEPLTNEPGFENSKDVRIQIYSDFIEHQNLKVACLEQILLQPQGFEPFYGEMKRHFVENESAIFTKLTKLKEEKNGIRLQLNYANVNLVTDYEKLIDLFHKVKQATT